MSFEKYTERHVYVHNHKKIIFYLDKIKLTAEKTSHKTYRVTDNEAAIYDGICTLTYNFDRKINILPTIFI